MIVLMTILLILFSIGGWIVAIYLLYKKSERRQIRLQYIGGNFYLKTEPDNGKILIKVLGLE